MSIPRTLAVPASARRVTLGTTRGPLAALDAAPAGGATRPPVLLVPGFTGSKEDFLEQLDPLAGRGHRVVAIDQRGQHESPGGDDAALYSLASYAADVVEVASALDDGEGVHLLGHSYGGLVVQNAALAEPSVVRSLTLLCSGPGPLPAEATRETAALRTGLTTLGNEPVWQVMRARRVAERGAEAAEIEAFLAARFVATSPHSLIAMAETLTVAPDRVDELAALGLPCHVVTGAGDTSWPLDEQEQMARRLGAPWTVIPGAAHSPNVEAPEALDEALAGFLDGVDERVAR